VINPLVEELASHTDLKTARALLGRPRGSHSGAKAPKPARKVRPRPAPANALTDDPLERARRTSRLRPLVTHRVTHG
jgi:hypothetical protein